MPVDDLVEVLEVFPDEVLVPELESVPVPVASLVPVPVPETVSEESVLLGWSAVLRFVASAAFEVAVGSADAV